MNADVTSARLDDGAFAGALRPATARAASTRAGAGVSGTGAGALLAGLLLVLLAVAVTTAVIVFRPPSEAPTT